MLKEKMEYVKQIIALEMLLILVFASLIIIDSADSITGLAVQGVTKESVLKELETAVPQLDIVKEANEFNLCLIVNIDAQTKYSYAIIKIGDVVAITISNNIYCGGQDKEDFIVSYISYDKLKEHMTQIPSFEELKASSDGTNFYVLPSKEILSGSVLANPVEFEERFNNVLSSHFTSAEVNQILNPQTAETRQAATIFSYTFYFVVGLIVLVIVISVLIFTHAKKPEVAENLELVAYVKSYLAQGYAEEQIKQSLLQSGWNEEQVLKALKTAALEVSAPQNFT